VLAFIEQPCPPAPPPCRLWAASQVLLVLTRAAMCPLYWVVRCRRERRGDAGEEGQGGGGGNPYGAFIAMDNLMDKLNLLDYDKHFCRKRDIKPIGRQYFAITSNANEQLYLFVSSCGRTLSHFLPPPPLTSHIQAHAHNTAHMHLTLMYPPTTVDLRVICI